MTSPQYMVKFPAFVNHCIGPTGKTDSWWMHQAMVRPDRQRQGIARNLINLVREERLYANSFRQAKLKGETLACSTTTPTNALVYQAIGFELKEKRDMPSPWGDWPLYVFALDTTMRDQEPEESIALLNEDEAHEELEKRASAKISAPQSKWSSWVSRVVCLLILVDLAVYLYIFRSLLVLSDDVLNDLEFRNPYIGLNELYASGRVNASRYEPIVNEPRIATQISSVEPDKVFPEDEHRWLSTAGTMSPLDRHLHVSSNVHTILQFRAMDYGMERCALALRLPSDRDKQDWAPGNGPVSVDVCALGVDRPLDPRALSWASRPSCREPFGTLTAGPGEETRLPAFPCSWGTLYTYEVACASESPDCQLDVWANRNGTWVPDYLTDLLHWYCVIDVRVRGYQRLPLRHCIRGLR
ncbi:hypothetical protein IEO21_07266 [Rhodonia placenta]|uniref:Ubiquitin 3 binding protein But2 C-terminal domain-containing protein n=1 Tax=Rhodonia placenta TaxID=104341 RepID=A0A8H7NYP2_9APHY|nr:hypothetical protein IEO21_07266 [Postia placenta]